MLEGFMQEINRFMMAGGREESRIVQQQPGVMIASLPSGIWTRQIVEVWRGRFLNFRTFCLEETLNLDPEFV